MNPKKLIPLALVLTALVAWSIWNHAQNVSERAGMQIGRQPVEDLGLLADSSAIFRVEILLPEGRGERIVLVKRSASGLWVIESHSEAKARKATIEHFLKLLESIQGEIRADNPAVLSDFRLTEEQAIHIRLFDSAGKEQAHMFLSPLRPRGTQNFVRKAGSNKVLLTTADLLGDLGIFSDQDKLTHLLFADQESDADKKANGA